MTGREQNNQFDKTKKEKQTGLLEILKDLDGKEFIVTIPIMGEGEKHEHRESV